MQNSPMLLDLADAVHDVRSGKRHGCSIRERHPTVRTWLGNRLITLGERIANDRTVTAAR